MGTILVMDHYVMFAFIKWNVDAKGKQQLIGRLCPRCNFIQSFSLKNEIILLVSNLLCWKIISWNFFFNSSRTLKENPFHKYFRNIPLSHESHERSANGKFIFYNFQFVNGNIKKYILTSWLKLGQKRVVSLTAFVEL